MIIGTGGVPIHAADIVAATVPSGFNKVICPGSKVASALDKARLYKTAGDYLKRHKTFVAGCLRVDLNSLIPGSL